MNEVVRELEGEIARRLGARGGMCEWMRYRDAGYEPAVHHRLLIRALERVESGEVARLMVSMPPGSAKSTYTSVEFPAWYLGRNGGHSVIAASHTSELAERFGRRVRNIVASREWAAVFGGGLAEDSGAAGRWDTKGGGEYFAAGVGGAITGRRADLVVIDDPVKSREDADSERSRERAWDWYVNDLLTRLKPGGRQIVVATRWHEDDLMGRILEREGDKWEVIKLPMLAVEGDPLGRGVGDRLWPEWFTDGMVESAKLDARSWHALYQQEPTGDEGDYFKREWIQTYDELPKVMKLYGASDFAVTEGGGDWTEHGVFGVDPGGNVFVVDWWRGRTAPNIWIESLLDLIQKHGPMVWFGESGPIRRSVEPFLLKRQSERNAWCRIEWMASISEKDVRARGIQALMSMGKVWFPRYASWREAVEGQLLRFPAGRNDDAVDVMSLIGRGLEHISTPLRRKLKPIQYSTAGVV